jgi:hypothetical protein
MNTMPVFIRTQDGDGHFSRLKSEPIRDMTWLLSSRS